MASSKARGRNEVEVTSGSGSVPQAPSVSLLHKVVGDGLQVCLKHIPGMTAPKLLPFPFYFQAPPMDDLTRQYAFNWTDYDTVSAGQFARPGSRQLATITFQSLFVDYDAFWTNLRAADRWGSAANAPTNTPAPNPQDLTDQLHALLNSGTPFELIVGQIRLWGRNDVHWAPAFGNAATLRTMSVAEKAGEVDARYVNVEFHEHRSLALAARRKGSKTGARDPHRGRKFPAHVYIMPNGDATEGLGGPRVPGVDRPSTLYSLAKHFYGQSSAWSRISKANGIDWQPSRSLGQWVVSRKDRRGQTLTIPAPPTRVVAEKQGTESGVPNV